MPVRRVELGPVKATGGVRRVELGPAETERPQIGAWEPGWWGSIKEHILSRPEAGRLTEPGREEKFHKAMYAAPETALRTIGDALDRASRIVAGAAEPGMAAISKRVGAKEPAERKLIPSITGGLKAAVRKPGAPTEAPEYGEAWARSWREPMTGKPAKPWEVISQDEALKTLLLFGPLAAKARSARLAKIKPPVTEVGAARLKPTKFKAPWRTVSGRLQKAGEPIPEVTIKAPAGETPVQKLTRLIKTGERIETSQRKLRHVEMQKRVGRYAGTLEKREGREAFYAARGQLKGALPTAEFTPPELQMSPAEMNSLVEQLRTSNKLLVLQKGNAFDGLEQIFRGQLPQRNKLLLLEKEFGPELIKAILGKRPLSTKIFEGAVDAANFPRTLLTAYDLSASLRQNYIAGIRHPVKWSKSFVAQLKALTSEKNALAIHQGIQNSKYYPQAVQYKLYLPEPSTIAGPLGARPEEFMSRFARIAPGVKMSERAFITMGNKMRFELFSHYYPTLSKGGATEADFVSLAKYLNALTGRGSLGQFEKFGAEMNALLFSPRYIASRFQTLSAIGSHSAAVRKIAAADVASFVGLNLSLLATAKFFWGDKIDVEIDPRSSDFGKLRIGNTRLDLWAGFLPLARYTTQTIMGERKAALTGKISEAPRMGTAGRFGRSKLAPAPGFIIDMYTGKTFVGDEMKLAKWKEQLWYKFFPLAGQDIADAIAYQGGGAAWLTIPAATLGIGAETWPIKAFTQATLLKDEQARHYFGKNWDELTFQNQKLLRQVYPEIDQWEEKGRFERTGGAFMERVVNEQSKTAQKIQKQLPNPLQKEMARLYIGPGGLQKTILGGWELSDQRYERYQDLTAKYLIKGQWPFAQNLTITQFVKTSFWRKLPDEQKKEIMREVMNKAKAAARVQVYSESLMAEQVSR